MKIKAILFVAAFLTWIFLAWAIDLQHIIAGVLVGLLVSIVTSDIFENKPAVFRRPSRYLWFLYYCLLFIWECLKANLDGAYRVIHPDAPIKPGIVKVRTTLKSDAGLTFLANSLTLKPGTMTVDIDKEKGFLYVHWVDVQSQEIDKATELVVSRFERVLKRIFE